MRIFSHSRDKVEDNYFPLKEIEEAGFFEISLAKPITALQQLAKNLRQNQKKINQKSKTKGSYLQDTEKICQY